MGRADTSMGAGASRFPTTSLSLFAGAERARGLREHVEMLCRRYWKPVYYFVRRRWSKSDAEAKDLTQEFFVHLLEGDALERFDPAKGNFRAWIKPCLQNFLVSDDRARRARKRGGGASFVPIEEAAVPDVRENPEDAFDRDWSGQILSDAVAELERKLRESDRAAVFEVFRLHDLAGDAAPGYDEIALRTGLKRSDVGNHLRAARREFRRIVMEHIGAYVGEESEIVSEEERILRRLL